MSIDEVKQAIQDGNAKWIAAYRTQDPAMLASLFTHDGAILASQGSVIQGPSRIEVAAQTWMKSMGPAEMTIQTTGVWLMGEIAYETGEFEYRFTPPGDKNPGKRGGCYVVVWKLEDGEWRIYRDLGLPN